MRKGEADRARLEHIVEAIDFIIRHTGHLENYTFYQNELLKYAVLKQIEIVGEAANNLSDDLIAKRPEVPWRSLIGIRHKLVHGYFLVDWTTVWEAASEELPLVLEPVKRILQEIQ